MPVSIDTVYQRVLVLANKEQRGYITPQEFNLLANQAQMEIFEQYFYDIKQFNRVPGNTQEYSDPLSVLYEKTGIFEVEEDDGWMVLNMPTTDNTMYIPWDKIHKLGTVRVGQSQVELVNSKDFHAARFSPLTVPSKERPLGYTNTRGLTVANAQGGFVLPGTSKRMSISFTATPPTVQWAYVIINDKPLYNDNISVDFELHSSEETGLVYKILKLAGVNLKAQDVAQVGEALETAQVKQQKQ